MQRFHDEENCFWFSMRAPFWLCDVFSRKKERRRRTTKWKEKNWFCWLRRGGGTETCRAESSCCSNLPGLGWFLFLAWSWADISALITELVMFGFGPFCYLIRSYSTWLIALWPCNPIQIWLFKRSGWHFLAWFVVLYWEFQPAKLGWLVHVAHSAQPDLLNPTLPYPLWLTAIPR